MRKIIVLIFILLCIPIFAFASATDVYLSQSGSGDGSSCGAARTYTWFNDAGNWGAGATQIGAGTTVHVCGPISVASGSIFTVQGSGSAGSPVTLKMEDGASMTSVAGGGGFVNIDGKTYITVDGGTNGIMRTTHNGSALTYQNTMGFVQINNSSHIEVKNITMGPAYVHVQDSPEEASGSAGVQITSNASYIDIHNNTIFDAAKGIYVADAYGAAISNINIYNNTISKNNWNIGFGLVNNTTGRAIRIYNNDLSDNINWDDPPNANHHNGIFMFQDFGGVAKGDIQDVWIYNNYLHGNAGYLHTTSAMHFCEGVTNVWIFNNVFYYPTSTWGTGYIYLNLGQSNKDIRVYNNTFMDAVNSALGVDSYSTNSITSKNNIFRSLYRAHYTGTGALKGSNYNLYYGITRTDDGWGNLWSYTNWKSYTGFDANSVTTNPLLNSGGTLQAGSGAINAGENLTSLCSTVAPLCYDKAGTLRPTTGAWEIGAYEFTTGDTTAPVVTITLPTSSATYSTSSSSLNISGTATDAVGVTSVKWSNNGSAYADCTGTTDWSKTGIALTSGVNVITIRAYDAAGLYGSDVLTVTYNPADTTPDQFVFTDETNVPLSTEKTSNTITVAGISASAAVTVSGGTYSKNGAAYTPNSGTAVAGDTFSVRQTSSSGYSTATSVILSVGGVTDAYTVTTTSGNIVTSPVLPNGLIMGNGVVMR